MNIYHHSNVFMDNDSTREYYEIILESQRQNRKKLKRTDPNFIYYEKHHVLPKSLFQEYKREKWNLVLLTAQEHIRCHKLLMDMTTDISRHKMICAYWKMAQTYDETMNRVEMSPFEYQQARELFSATITTLNQKPCKESTKKLISIANGGRSPSREAVENSVKARKGKKRQLDIVEKISSTLKGNTNVRGKTWWNNGEKSTLAFNPPDSTWGKGRLKFTEEHIKNIGKSQLGNTKKRDWAREKMKNENESKTGNS
jgi:predicted metal-binding transcription factor (methanogenesis marker protein 9)